MVLKKFAVNPDILKLVALITMTIDHLYKILFPNLCGFTIGTEVIGRVAMPLFAGLMMYHLAKKQVFKKYLIRLFCFGMLSLFVFIPFTYNDQTAALPLNILLSFAIAVLALCLMEYVEKDDLAPYWIKKFIQVIIFVLMAAFSFVFEYTIVGFCYFLMFYFYFRSPKAYKFCILLILGFFINKITIGSIFSLLTTLFFINVDMERTYPRLIKHWYTFYMYYPLHKVLFFSLAYLMIG